MYKKILSLLILCAVGLMLFACGGGSTTPQWGHGVTADIPEFPSQWDNFTVAPDGSHAAAYYSNVTGEDINRYVQALSQSGIQLKGDKYPKSATLDGRVLVLHYNVTEMLFSVTVTETATSAEAEAPTPSN